MAIKFIYIDDNTSIQAEGTTSGLSKKDLLSVEHENPTGDWDRQMDFIIESAKIVDGFILDQRLDEGKSTSDKEAKYRGTSLAQEIRVLSKEGKINDLPLVLLSAEANITSSFDYTGADLFDMVISKEEIAGIYPQVRVRLIALAEGYRTLRGMEKGNILDNMPIVLGVSNDDIQRLDPRFVTKLEKILSTQPHLISNFLLKKLIKHQGLLIDEHLLAARLGVDIINSSEWSTVLEILEPNIYKGIFSLGWRRWWMAGLEEWWESWNEDLDLRNATATERVDAIKKNFNLSQLTPSKKIEYARSESYWTLCAGTNVPIDITDGLLVDNQDALYPWQDRRYVSYLAALKRVGSENWKEVAALEKPKLENLQSIYKRERVKRQ